MKLKEVFFMVVFMLGVEKFIIYLWKYGIFFVLVISLGFVLFDMKISCYKEFFSLFFYIVLGDDFEVQYGKLDLDIFLVCVKRFFFFFVMEKCFVFEDVFNGVEVVLVVGMQVVMVFDGNLS